MIDQQKDWLAREIKYESKISAWDLDEPNKLKRHHEENCPRQKLEKEHVEVHGTSEQANVVELSKRAQFVVFLIPLLFSIVFFVALFIIIFS